MSLEKLKDNEGFVCVNCDSDITAWYEVYWLNEGLKCPECRSYLDIEIREVEDN